MENQQGYLKDSSDDNLILHGLKAIKSGYRDEKEEMTEKNVEISIINENGFKTLNGEEIRNYMKELSGFDPEKQM